MKPNHNNKVPQTIAYFHYNTLRSDISKHEDEESAKKDLYKEWKFLLDENKNQVSLRERISK